MKDFRGIYLYELMQSKKKQFHLLLMVYQRQVNTFRGRERLISKCFCWCCVMCIKLLTWYILSLWKVFHETHNHIGSIIDNNVWQTVLVSVPCARACSCVSDGLYDHSTVIITFNEQHRLSGWLEKATINLNLWLAPPVFTLLFPHEWRSRRAVFCFNMCASLLEQFGNHITTNSVHHNGAAVHQKTS